MKVFRILRAVLREVFEEAAYERFCLREGVKVNNESYSRFLRETDQLKQHKVRCC